LEKRAEQPNNSHIIIYEYQEYQLQNMTEQYLK